LTFSPEKKKKKKKKKKQRRKHPDQGREKKGSRCFAKETSGDTLSCTGEKENFRRKREFSLFRKVAISPSSGSSATFWKKKGNQRVKGIEHTEERERGAESRKKGEGEKKKGGKGRAATGKFNSFCSRKTGASRKEGEG